MPEFPVPAGSMISDVGSEASTTLGTLLTAAGTANTKGSVVELVASTPHDAAWVMVHLTNASTTADYLVDILIGDSPETVLIPDLYASMRAAGADFGPYLFPVFIPAGSRLSARCQSSTASATVRVNLTLIAQMASSGGTGPSVVASYGATASSLGTNIDPGATANVDSAWVQITASTVRQHTWMCIAGRFGDRSITAATSWRLSIGIGSAPEQVLIPNLNLSADVTSDAPYKPVMCLPVFIPAGSRLTARVRSNVTTDGDRDVWLRLYCC